MSAYIDGEVDDAERAVMDALLASDPAARAIEADMRMVAAALASLAQVRAPRSFAIPAAPAPAQPRALMHRLEMAMRASAAVVALLFVVAVVNPVGTSSSDESATSGGAAFAQVEEAQSMAAADATDAAAGTEALRSSEGMPPAAGPGVAPEPADTSAANDGAAPQGEAGGASIPAGEPDAPGGQADKVDELTAGGFGGGPTGEPDPGTVAYAPASEDAGGVAPALATLAILLTALSVLMAWSQRKGNVSGR